jgi:hypothetical protein
MMSRGFEFRSEDTVLISSFLPFVRKANGSFNSATYCAAPYIEIVIHGIAATKIRMYFPLNLPCLNSTIANTMESTAINMVNDKIAIFSNMEDLLYGYDRSTVSSPLPSSVDFFLTAPAPLPQPSAPKATAGTHNPALAGLDLDRRRQARASGRRRPSTVIQGWVSLTSAGKTSPSFSSWTASRPMCSITPWTTPYALRDTHSFP